MELYERLEQILVKLRPAFNREATFEWFVLLLWGALLSTQPAAVTSYLNGLGLGEGYYASAKVLQPFRERGLHLISRVRISTVAHAAFSPVPGHHGPGRPRTWGSKVKLRELFVPKEDCTSASVNLYGKTLRVYYQCFEFYWDSADELVSDFAISWFPQRADCSPLSWAAAGNYFFPE